jgi:putative ABC transport system ATP-binding protein
MSNGELRCEGVEKIYNIGQPNEFTALKGLDILISEGEYVSIIGPSGSGKSTLLNMISCLDSPTKGDVYIEGIAIKKLSDNQKARLRREKLGFIFQQFNLIRTMSCWENVELPMRFKGTSAGERKKNYWTW